MRVDSLDQIKEVVNRIRERKGVHLEFKDYERLQQDSERLYDFVNYFQEELVDVAFVASQVSRTLDGRDSNWQEFIERLVDLRESVRWLDV